MNFLKIYFPGHSYSDNKNAIKFIFRKYKCLWSREDSGWYNQEMGYSIAAEFEGSKKPVTLFCKGPEDFISELKEHFVFNGGEVLEEGKEGPSEESLPYSLRERTINRLLQNMEEDLTAPRFDYMKQAQKEALINTAKVFWEKRRAEALKAL
jgi:hypothetical protein